MPIINENITATATVDENFENGYVRNNRLHRRWITAQILKAMKHPNGGYDTYVEALTDEYVFHVMVEETKVLGHLDEASLRERERFFNKNVILSILKSYVHKFRGKPIMSTHIYTRRRHEDDTMPYATLIDRYQSAISSISNTNDYLEISNIIKAIPVRKPIKKMTPPDEWKNAFKGAGSYYALKNLVMWDGCTINGWDKERSLTFIEQKADEGNYKLLFLLLKQTVNQNNFDLRTFLSNQN